MQMHTSVMLNSTSGRIGKDELGPGGREHHAHRATALGCREAALPCRSTAQQGLRDHKQDQALGAKAGI